MDKPRDLEGALQAFHNPEVLEPPPIYDSEGSPKTNSEAELGRGLSRNGTRTWRKFLVELTK